MIYLDTGCLLKLYYPEPQSNRVAQLVNGQLIAYTPLHELELTNALELKRFRKEATLAQVRATLALVEGDARAGVLSRTPIDWDSALRESTALAKAYSHITGSRSLDLMHCAAAHQLAISAFLTTDERQRRVAQKLGLRCPAV